MYNMGYRKRLNEIFAAINCSYIDFHHIAIVTSNKCRYTEDLWAFRHDFVGLEDRLDHFGRKHGEHFIFLAEVFTSISNISSHFLQRESLDIAL